MTFSGLGLSNLTPRKMSGRAIRIGRHKLVFSPGLPRNGSAERVALGNITGLDATFEPFNPLCGRTMGKAFGHNITLTSLLQAVITDGRCSIDAFFDIALLQNALVVACPHSRQTVCLQFHANRQAVGIGF